MSDITSPAPGSLVRRVLANVGLALAALFVSLLLAEAAVRLIAPQQLILIRPDVWQPADSVGYLFRSNLRTDINTGEREVRLLTDEDGFRVGSPVRSDSGLRVLLMGDSFMAALQVEYEQSLPGILAQRLPGRLGTPVVVDNGGVSGWGPAEYYFRTLSLLGRKSYDLVVVALFVGNDAVNLPAVPMDPVVPVIVHRFRLPGSLSWTEIVDAVLRPVNDFLETHSHLFVLLKARSSTLLMKVGLTPEYFPDEFRKTETSSDRWSITAHICRDLATAAQNAGAATLFVLLPTQYQVDSTVFRQYVTGFSIDPGEVDLDQPSRLLGEELQKEGLRVVDALPAFRQAYDSGAILFGRIDRHLSPSGHRLLAETIEDHIVRLLAATASGG